MHKTNSWRLLALMVSSTTRCFVSYGTGWKRGVERPSTWLEWAQVRRMQTINLLVLLKQFIIISSASDNCIVIIFSFHSYLLSHLVL